MSGLGRPLPRQPYRRQQGQPTALPPTRRERARAAFDLVEKGLDGFAVKVWVSLFGRRRTSATSGKM